MVEDEKGAHCVSIVGSPTTLDGASLEISPILPCRLMLISLGEFGLVVRANSALNGEGPILISAFTFDISSLYFEGLEVHIVIDLVLLIRSVPAFFGNDVGKLPSSFAAIFIFSPTALQHIFLTIPFEEQCLVFLFESQSELYISILAGSLQVEDTLGWMFASTLNRLGRVIDVIEGEPMDYCVVVFVVFEEVASPVGSIIRHQSIIEYTLQSFVLQQGKIPMSSVKQIKGNHITITPPREPALHQSTGR